MEYSREQDNNEQSEINAVLDKALDKLDDSSDSNDSDNDSEGCSNEDDLRIETDIPENVSVMSTPLSENDDGLHNRMSPVKEVFMGPERPPLPPEPLSFQEDPQQLLLKLLEGLKPSDSHTELDFLNDEAITENILNQMKDLEAELSNACRRSNDTESGRMPNSDRAKKSTNEKKPKKTAKSTNKDDTVKRAISHLVQDMSQAATTNDTEENFLDDNGDEMNDEMGMLNELLKGLSGATGGDGLNPDSIVDGMMEHLLSKDLMYEPMKQVAERFPSWLDEHKHVLSPEQYKQ